MKSLEKMLLHILLWTGKTIFRILRDNPQYHNVSCYWVPKLLTEHQKPHRLDRATGIRERLQNLGEKRYDIYAVEDETWFRFGVEYIKKRPRVWKPFEKERPQIPASNLSPKTCLLMILFTCNKRISVWALPYRTTIDGDTYADFVKETGVAKSENIQVDPIHNV